MMPVVSVINYKGGVGKTTLTTNLGAELAWRGYRVLLLDLDPQASLTFSLVRPEFWTEHLEQDRTIKAWYDATQSGSDLSLASLVLQPEAVNRRLRASGKPPLDLIPSHLGLINVDLELATGLAGASLRQTKLNYMRVHRRLADGLEGSGLTDYDLILIDCPPNFNIVTKTAIIASEHILIPAKADYLSTLGIDYLKRSLDQLVRDYNDYAQLESANAGPAIDPAVLGIVFTMIQIYGQQPVSAARPYIRQARTLDLPVFETYLRENKTSFASAAEEGVPVILGLVDDYRGIRTELEGFVDEFIEKLGL
jgi:chromosome partitioning protein